jgi:hypothetical protein
LGSSPARSPIETRKCAPLSTSGSFFSQSERFQQSGYHFPESARAVQVSPTAYLAGSDDSPTPAFPAQPACGSREQRAARCAAASRGAERPLARRDSVRGETGRPPQALFSPRRLSRAAIPISTATVRREEIARGLSPDFAEHVNQASPCAAAPSTKPTEIRRRHCLTATRVFARELVEARANSLVRVLLCEVSSTARSARLTPWITGRLQTTRAV